MTFSLGEHSQKNQAQWKAAFGNLTRIYASGEIDLKTVSDFKKFMAKHPQITHAILFFDSCFL